MARKRKKPIQNKPTVTQVVSELDVAKVETKPETTESKLKARRFTQWCLGTILGLLFLAVVGNHISAVIPNPFQFAFSQFSPTSEKPVVWYAAGVKNSMKHAVSVGIWKNSEAAEVVYTLQPEQTEWFSENAPIYLSIQGDMIAQQTPRFRLTHTYEGEEAYELEAKTFDRKPSDNELKSLKPNRITEILGGPLPKTVSFVDGTKITFDVIGPTGIKLKTVLPIMAEGQKIFPFQVPNSEK